MWALVAAGERHSLFSQDTISKFLSEGWLRPRRSNTGRRPLLYLFAESLRDSNQSAETIKGSMSDLLSLYGLLRHFAETRIAADPRMSPVLRNFQLVCKAVDIVRLTKYTRVPRRYADRQLEAMHLQSHVETSGTRRAMPKKALGIRRCRMHAERR